MRRTGVLDDHCLGQERPLGKARLLFEIAAGCGDGRRARAPAPSRVWG
ncbi:hypothetical protein ACIPSA_32940 [Streptomyces sp. NPDC086549]